MLAGRKIRRVEMEEGLRKKTNQPGSGPRRRFVNLGGGAMLYTWFHSNIDKISSDSYSC
jgi:hypothetical protein